MLQRMITAAAASASLTAFVRWYPSPGDMAGRGGKYELNKPAPTSLASPHLDTAPVAFSATWVIKYAVILSTP